MKALLAALLLLVLTASPVAAATLDTAQVLTDATPSGPASYGVFGDVQQVQEFAPTRIGRLKRIDVKLALAGPAFDAPLVVQLMAGVPLSGTVLATAFIWPSQLNAYPRAKWVQLIFSPRIRLVPHRNYSIVLTAPGVTTPDSAYMWTGANDAYPFWSWHNCTCSTQVFHDTVFDFNFRTYLV